MAVTRHEHHLTFYLGTDEVKRLIAFLNHPHTKAEEVVIFKMDHCVSQDQSDDEYERFRVELGSCGCSIDFEV